jgi:molybdopterin biosynthesis enzyme
MSSDGEQKIRQLTPLAAALAAIDELSQPVKPREMDVGDAVGFVLAADVVAASLPPRATAVLDGWAVRADDLTDASSYAPVPLARIPARVETGDEIPDGADAVAPIDAIVMQGDRAEAIVPVAIGEGVAPAGSEADPAVPLRRAGQRVRAIDAAVFAAAQISTVSVCAPRLLIATAREDLRLLPSQQMIARDCTARGGVRVMRNGMDVEAALAASDADAIVIVGGSGSGKRDRSVQVLARAGSVRMHGIGLTPGETAALGNTRAGVPVLIVPGRLDAALAVWLVLGRRMLAGLSGERETEPQAMLTLSRKIASTVGLAEVVPMRRNATTAEPLAGKTLPLAALARANGWLLVPPESEGYPAGAKVAVNDWP